MRFHQFHIGDLIWEIMGGSVHMPHTIYLEKPKFIVVYIKYFLLSSVIHKIITYTMVYKNVKF